MKRFNSFPKTHIILIAAVVSGIAFGISRHVLPVIFPTMRASLGMPYTQLGLFTSAYFFTYTLFSVICGYLSDKVGFRPIIPLGCLICAIGTIGMGVSESFLYFFTFSLMIGIGAGGLFIPMVSFTMKYFKERKGFVVSLVLIGEGLVGISIGLITPFIVLVYSWRHVWWVFGLSLLVLTIFLWLSIHNGNPNVNLTSPENRGKITFSQVLQLPKIWSLGAIYLLHGFTRGILVTFSVTYLVNKGATYDSASYAFSFLAVGFIPGAFFSGFFLDRLNQKGLLSSLLSLQILSTGLLLLNLEWFFVYTLFTAIGYCLTGIPTVMNVIPSQFFIEETYGKTLGFLSLMFNLGAAASPIIGGYISYLTHSLSTTMFTGILTSCLALIITISKVKHSRI